MLLIIKAPEMCLTVHNILYPLRKDSIKNFEIFQGFTFILPPTQKNRAVPPKILKTGAQYVQTCQR